MRRRLLHTTILVLLLLVLNACSSSDGVEKNLSELKPSETESISSELTTQDSSNNAETISVDVDSPKQEKYESKTFASISDMIRQSDTYYAEHFNTNETNWADKDLYDNALAAYDREIGSLTAECICEMNYCKFNN